MGSQLREDQQRVKSLLANTIKLLCEKGLAFSQNLKVQGVIGVTIDDSDVFIIHMNETVENSFVNMSSSVGRAIGSNPIPSSTETSIERPPKRQPNYVRGPDRPMGSIKTIPQFESSTVVVDNEPCIVIKPEPVDKVIDLESSHSDLPIVFDGRESMTLPTSSDLNSNASRDHGEPPTKRRASMPPTSTPPVTSPIMSVDSDTSQQEVSQSEPYITGFVPNIADSMRKTPQRSPSWDSSAGYQLSKIASHIADSARSKSYLDDSASNESLFRMSDMYDSRCVACQHYVRRVKHNGERQKMKRKGVPESELPKFTEQPIPPDKSCQVCMRRKQYFREKSLLHERRKRARVFPSSSVIS